MRPFDRPIEPNERAERHQLRHAADQDLADDEAVDGAVPLLRLGALERERNLLGLAVHLQDVGLHFVADVVEVLRLLAALPREFGHVREAVGAAEVDEHAKVGDRRDAARADLPFFEVVEDLVLLLLAHLGHRRALGEDDAVALAVELDDLQAHALADEAGERIRGIRIIAADAVDLRQRDEGVDAIDVDEDAATVVAGDLRVEDLAGFVARREDVPALFAARAVERDDGVAFRRRRLQDHHLDGVASLQLGRAIDAEGEHLALGDDRFSLRAHIDDEAVGRSAHDHPLDNLAAAEVARLRGFRIEKRPHVHFFDVTG